MTSSPQSESQLAAWYAEHRGIFAKVSRAYTRGARDAAELEQEMLFQLWRSLPRFHGEAKPSTWIYRVCLNTAMTWRRGANRRERGLDEGADLRTISSDTASPASDAEKRDWIERLYEALQHVSVGERALVLLMLEGLTHREIAEITGLTENHVGVSLLRARRHLALLMKGVTDELE